MMPTRRDAWRSRATAHAVINVHLLALALTLIAGTSTAWAQCTGEPPSDSRCSARVIPGAPGVYDVVMDLTAATQDLAPACGTNVGNDVWFEVTPTVSGPLTFTTCRPATSFDTVVQVWRNIGDCELPVSLDELCVDDSPSALCTNACAGVPRASTVTFSAQAATSYYFQVGAWDQNSAGCDLCLGVRVKICGADVTPPVATISSPIDRQCYCGADQITGTVMDFESGLDRWALEFRAANGFTWTRVQNGTSSIANGVLGNLGPFGLSEGAYHLRLTATNGCGAVDADNVVLFTDSGFDVVDFQSPMHGAVVGGRVCPRGTIANADCFDHYTVTYRPSGTGNLQPVDTLTPTYTTQVTNNTLATWNTTDLALPDGDYDLSVQGETKCGAMTSVLHGVTVDNTPPLGQIVSPHECAYVEGMVDVIGTALDANLSHWVLQYTGGGQSGWVTIRSDTVSVNSASLGNWDTSLLRPCAYTLRLVVFDKATVNCQSSPGHRVEFTRSVNVGFCGDFDVDDDGDVDLFDYSAFHNDFIGPMP